MVYFHRRNNTFDLIQTVNTSDFIDQVFANNQIQSFIRGNDRIGIFCDFDFTAKSLQNLNYSFFLYRKIQDRLYLLMRNIYRPFLWQTVMNIGSFDYFVIRIYLLKNIKECILTSIDKMRSYFILETFGGIIANRHSERSPAHRNRIETG